MSGETILVVDDEPTIVEVVELYLLREGFKVLTAADGDAALKAVQQQRPDLRMMTIPTPPTGLCIVTGLDRHSTVLQRSYADSVARYMDMTFDDYTSWSWQMPPQIANRKVSITAYVASLRQGAARQAADTEAY